MRYHHSLHVALVLTTVSLGACSKKSGGGDNPPPAADTSTNQTPTPTPTPSPSATPTPLPTDTSTSNPQTPSLAALAAAQAALGNFHQVNTKLYRSADPGEEGIPAIKGLGVKTVLYLKKDVISPTSANKEKALVEAQGMKFVRVDMGIIGAPTPEEVRDALAVINDVNNQPVLVHCERGADRTGIVVAAYHIKNEGWDVERAKTDMYSYGFNRLYWWWPSVLEKLL